MKVQHCATTLAPMSLDKGSNCEFKAITSPSLNKVIVSEPDPTLHNSPVHSSILHDHKVSTASAFPCVAPSTVSSDIAKLRKPSQLSAFHGPQAAKTLLTFVATVNGKPAKVLIDGGAEGNVISAAFCKRHYLALNACSPIPVVLPNGSTHITNSTAPITLTRDSYTGYLEPLLFCLTKYDLILGKPWLAEVNPQINWRTNDLFFTHNGQQIHWTCRGYRAGNITQRTNGILLSAVHFASMAALPGSETFLV